MHYHKNDHGNLPEREATPEALYANRRQWLERAGLAAVGLIGTTFVGQALADSAGKKVERAPLKFAKDANPPKETLTPLEAVSSYNNFYEFGFGKSDPAQNAGGLRTAPWTIKVGGKVAKPKTFDVQKLLNASLTERVYRLRCVEAWSMVIPWVGFPLAEIVRSVEPLGSAKYVAFRTLHDPKQMPEQRIPGFPWPYQEGLRLDEAMHPLTLMAVGLYGKVLPNQNGAPIRLVVPWKYGFKSIKSIVGIDLVESLPQTTWNRLQPDEYGFFANVNPAVDHPRWSQASERRIGDFQRRDTLPFNGYAAQVAQLYSGMDLRKFY